MSWSAIFILEESNFGDLVNCLAITLFLNLCGPHIFIYFLLLEQVITLSITGAINAILSKEHKREICRYLYNHQVKTLLSMYLFDDLLLGCVTIYYWSFKEFFLLICIVTEQRWWMGSAHRGAKHYVWFCFDLCHFEVAW